MKASALFIALTTCTCLLTAQDAASILQRSYEACQEVQEGYYKATWWLKHSSSTDTLKQSFESYFRKVESDSIFQRHFHHVRSDGDRYLGTTCYTGSELITLSAPDSTAIRYPVPHWGQRLKYIADPNFGHMFEHTRMYAPLVSLKSVPVPHDQVLDEYAVAYIGQDNVNGRDCYHVAARRLDDINDDSMFSSFELELQFWISKELWIPVQFTRILDAGIESKMTHQYQKFALDTFNLAPILDTSKFSITTLPSWYITRDSIPR